MKAWPELQHTLSHMHLALEALLLDRPRTARHHIEAIRAAVFFEDDRELEDEMACTMRGKKHPRPKKKGGKKTTKKKKAVRKATTGKKKKSPSRKKTTARRRRS